MNKPVYLGLSILEMSKTILCEFWYDYIKPKYGGKVKLCSMDTNSFIVSIKQKTFTEIWQKMVKQDLILQIMK